MADGDRNDPQTYRTRRFRVTFNEVTQQHDIQELPKRLEDQPLSKFPVVEIVTPDVSMITVPVVKQEKGE